MMLMREDVGDAVAAATPVVDVVLVVVVHDDNELNILHVSFCVTPTLAAAQCYHLGVTLLMLTAGRQRRTTKHIICEKFYCFVNVADYEGCDAVADATCVLSYCLASMIKKRV